MEPDPIPPPLEPGTILAGRYELLRVLGAGGMAVVYEGMHLRLRQRVAIKILHRHLWAHAEVISRFEREGRAIGKVRARHVVRVLDVDTSAEGAPFLVMELLNGRSLDEEIEQKGALGVPEAVHWVRQACAAVAAAHDEGIIHRDIKPSNLFLTEEDGERIVKVVDFGISKDVLDDGTHLTKTEFILGTPLYMAPEQFKSTKDVDARADVWALGTTLYEALAGRPPFIGGASTTVAVMIATEAPAPLLDVRPDVPPALLAVLDRALAKKKEERFPTVRAFADALRPFEAETSHAPRSVSRASYSAHPEAMTQLAMSDETRSALAASGPHGDPAATAAAPRGSTTRRTWTATRVALVAVLALASVGTAVALRSRSGSAAAAPAAPEAKASPPPPEVAEVPVSAPTVSASVAVPVVPIASVVRANSTQTGGRAQPTARPRTAPPKPTANPTSSASNPLFFPNP